MENTTNSTAFDNKSEPSKSAASSTGQPSLLRLAAAVRSLSPERATSYDDWVVVGMAIHSAYQDENGLSLFIEFSKRTTRNNFDDAACRKKWKQFNAHGGVTFRTVFLMAQHDGDGKKSARDPHLVANELAAKHYRHNGELTLRFYKSEWHLWESDCYQLLPDGEIRAKINGQIRQLLDRIGDDRPLRQQFVNDAIRALESVCLVASRVDMPEWLGNAPRPGDGDLLAMANGLLDLEGVIAGEEDVIHQHTPALFSATSWQYGYDPKAECLKWHSFLDEVLPDSKQQKCWQEFLGLCLTFDTSFHKFLLIHGPAHTGKSTATDVATALIGPDNVSNVPLEQFGGNFALAPTIGKLANIVSEIGRSNKQVAEGVLKAVVGGDRLKVERKFLDSCSAIPTIRLIFATNELPRFADRSEGIWRRVLILLFDNVISAADKKLSLAETICRTDLPGIFNWAIEGLRRLRHRGRFTVATESERALDQLRFRSNPARQFLDEECEVAVGEDVRCRLLYSSYECWCVRQQLKPLSQVEFGTEVHRAFPTIERKQKRSLGGRSYVYDGIRIQRDVRGI